MAGRRYGGWRGAAAVLAATALVLSVVVVAAFVRIGGAAGTVNIGQLVAVILAAVPLFGAALVWGSRSAAKIPPTCDSQLDRARDALRGLVLEQWRQEAAIRALGDPEPMPVRWRLADRELMDHDRFIATGRLSLTGRGDRIPALAGEFRRLRRRRLVILGGPGTGKTTLAVQLVLELVSSYQEGEPVPVLLTVAGWDTARHGRLQDWLEHRLGRDYPALRAEAFGSTAPSSLVKRGMILPVLDGLDELPPAGRAGVISALNRSLAETDQLILTSRSAEFGEAVNDAGEPLTAAAVVEPEPLTPAQAAGYLAACLPRSPGPAWRALLDGLRAGAGTPLATVLARPLDLWMLREVSIAPGADPAPLLDLPGPEAVRAHLLARLVPALIATRPPDPRGSQPFRPRRAWQADDVRRWLGDLAGHLDRIGTRDFLWWHLARNTFTKRAWRSVAGVAFGLIIALPGGVGFGLSAARTAPFGWPVAIGFGLGFGLLVLLILLLMVGPLMSYVVGDWLTDEPRHGELRPWRSRHERANRIREAAKLMFGMALIGATAPVTMIVAAHGLRHDLWGRLAPVLPPTVAACVVVGLFVVAIELLEKPALPGSVRGPAATWRADRGFTLLRMLASTVVATLAGTLFLPLLRLLVTPEIDLPYGVWLTMLACFVLMFGTGVRDGHAWLCAVVAIARLARVGRLPWRLMAFLDDAHRLGLLRTVGPAYQFRHAELHDHLAARPAVRSPGAPGTPPR